MGIAFYTGVSGMESFQKNLDVTAHNIANVNTNGYKKQRAVFQDLLYTRMNTHKNYRPEEAGEAAQEALALTADRAGHGSRVLGVDVLYAQAGLNQTDYPLDFAIDGDGFFAVSRNNGVEYTRNGTFSLSMTGNRSAMLIAADGAQVLDASGKPIKISFDANGEAIMEGVAEKIGIYQFQNPYALVPAAGSSFTATESSGPATAAKGANGEGKFTLLQGVLEVSSVDLGEEMVKVIESQRAFQLNSRIVQTADQLDEMINNLR